MYKVAIIPSARKDMDKLAGKVFTQIKNKILSLKTTPRPINCMKLTAEEGYRIRNGDYRILYRIYDKNKLVYIYRVKHRK